MNKQQANAYRINSEQSQNKRQIVTHRGHTKLVWDYRLLHAFKRASFIPNCADEDNSVYSCAVFERAIEDPVMLRQANKFVVHNFSNVLPSEHNYSLEY